MSINTKRKYKARRILFSWGAPFKDHSSYPCFTYCVYEKRNQNTQTILARISY